MAVGRFLSPELWRRSVTPLRFLLAAPYLLFVLPLSAPMAVEAVALASTGFASTLLFDGYRTVATIGPLFLLNAVLGALAAVAVLGTPRRWLGWISLAGAALQAGTLGALLLSLTVGLFGFHESTKASLVTATIVVELAGAVVLLALAVREFVLRRPVLC
jgi:hypothetical protein